MEDRATSWIAVAFATVSLIGQIVQNVINYRTKRSDAAINAEVEKIKAQFSVEMAILKNDLEYAVRDLAEERKQRAIVEQRLEELQNAQLSKRKPT